MAELAINVVFLPSGSGFEFSLFAFLQFIPRRHFKFQQNLFSTA